MFEHNEDPVTASELCTNYMTGGRSVTHSLKEDYVLMRDGWWTGELGCCLVMKLSSIHGPLGTLRTH